MSNNRITENVIEAWVQSYVRHNYGDPHAHFAMLLRLERTEAKQLCYEFIHSRCFLKAMLENS